MTTQSERAAIARMNAGLADILRGLRREQRQSQMMATGLDAMITVLGAEGAAVIRSAPGAASVEPEVLHRTGMIGLPAMSAAVLLWRAAIGTPVLSAEPSGRPMAVGLCRENPGEKVGVVFWRTRAAQGWSGEDVPLLDAVAGVVWLLMERELGQRDAYGSSSIDALTALLNQRTFVAEATRHIARLDRDALPGTLMMAEVDNLESAGLRAGSDAGDLVLRRAAMLLRSAVRPTDLVGRTGKAEFSIWLSGADHLTAAERAEDLCLEPPRPVGETAVCEVSFSIGIATRQAGENFADLARRAGEAMRRVRREGGGYWRVSLGRSD
jgi:diguanylate cyclase (GGDEF)-like protein